MKQTLKATAVIIGIIAAVVIDNQIKTKNMQTLKEIIITIIQLSVFFSVFPVWLCVGAYLRITRRDKFRNLSRVLGLYIFPAFGRWYIPMIYINA